MQDNKEKNVINSNIRGGLGDSATANTSTNIKENLYLAVNSDWLKKTEIPADLSMIGGFEELDIKVRKQLLHDFKEFIATEKSPQTTNFQKALDLFKLAHDFSKRNLDGLNPLKEDINYLIDLSNFKEFDQQLATLYKNGYILPFKLSVDTNMKNTDQYALYFSSPSLILPDASSYQTANADQMLTVFESQAIELFKMLDFSESQSKEFASNAIKFEKKLAKYAKTQEELNDIAAAFNPISIQKFINSVKSVSISDFFKILFDGNIPDQVVIMEPKFLEHFSEIVNENNFEELKSWLIVKFIYVNSDYLTQEFRETSFAYTRAVYGIQELSSIDKHAYQIANSKFSEVIGLYYAHKYFGTKAKQDVEEMIRKIVHIFKKRLENNTWLSVATKAEAIKKLDAMELRIGFPNRISKLYDLIQIDSNVSLYKNMLEAEKTTRAFKLSLLNKSVDRSLWGMPANVINAGYDPTQNSVVFPAAILQKPFYSIDYTRGQNLGGIGAVIAHEITHAFDPNGSKFDEKGNIRNWWTDADFAKFSELTQKEIDLYDGIVCGGLKTNGKQTVGENVADLGGLIAGVESAKQANLPLKDVFTQWATIWRQKATDQVRRALANLDPHAPSELRANVTVQNIDDFYETFNISENDGMWLSPADRVHIW